MSMEGMLWALKHAPVADVEERAILGILGEYADPDGCSAWPSQDTIASLALVADRTVRRRLDAMEKRGLLARGDQSLISKDVPPDHRPIVWDLQIPYSWFTDIDQVNRMRRGKGRRPLRPEDRPDLRPAPAPRRRADAGLPKPKRAGDIDGDPTPGLQVHPDERDHSHGLQVRADSESKGAGLVDRIGRSGSPTTKPLTPPLNPTTTPPAFGTAAGTNNSSQVQPTLTGEVPAPKLPDPRDVAFGIARRHLDKLAEAAPVPEGDLVKLQKGLVKYLKAYTPDEIFDALQRLGDPVPNSTFMYRTLRAVHCGERGTDARSNGRPERAGARVNEYWDQARAEEAAKTAAGVSS